MSEELKMDMKYLTNCAVLVTCGTDKLLIDGIFSGRQPFNLMDEALEREILRGGGDFKGLNHILVTHCHNDHYNGSKILKFLSANRGAKLIVPANARLDQEQLNAAGAAVFRLEEDPGRLQVLDFGHFAIEYRRIEHLTYKYPCHYCYNIVTEDANVLLTADMSFDHLPLLSTFTKRPDSTIFLNHIGLWHRRWRREIMELHYLSVYFYHLPDEERDLYGYRTKTIRYWERHKEEFPGGRLLGYETEVRKQHEIY